MSDNFITNLDANFDKPNSDNENDILKEAHKLVRDDRAKDYGSCVPQFTKVAELWSKLLGVTIHPEDIPLCIMALKVVRQKHKYKRDNLIDICGYAYLLEDIIDHYEAVT